ncbi:MAG: PD-(D/E)XK nuclease family protein [Bdellovibrionota bacterium]
MDDWLKSRIGLPGWQYVESLEDTTFHLLLSRLPQVELFYADEEKMETTVRSRFIESLLCQDKAELIHHSNTKNLESFFFLSEKESTIAQYDTFSSFGDYPYPRANFIKKTSATSLKKLITCPYHFLMSKLDLQKLGMPDDSRNKNEGEYLHKIVEVFFTGSLNQKKIIDPLDPDSHAIEDLKKIFLQRLKFLTDEILPEEYISSPLYFHLIRYAWPQYAEHLTKLLSHTPLKKPVGSYKEFKLGNYPNSHNSTTHILNYPITIIGSIDSIDRFSEGYILTDYKRKYVEDPISVRKGIAPQLLLYAKAISELQQPELRLPLKDGIFGYWSILNGEWKSQAVGENAREWGLSLGLITKKTPSIEELINNLDSLWQWRIQSIFNNKENFYPETDKRWCSLCDYKGVCRLDDPKFKEIIEDNSRLNKKLEEQFALKN